MTIKNLSDSETGRRSYNKEVDDFLENGLTTADIPQGRASFGQGENGAQTLSTARSVDANAPVQGSTYENSSSIGTSTTTVPATSNTGSSIAPALNETKPNALTSETQTTSMNNQEDSLG